MFGINGGELMLILLVVAIVVGPERLPAFAEQLGRWVRGLRTYVSTAKDRVNAELGTDEVDWEALDPRRYDPRRIVREALTDEPAKVRNTPRRYTAPPSAGRATGAGAAAVAASGARAARSAQPPGPAARTGPDGPDGPAPADEAGAPAPFDDEAT